jgi:hypothetical protein
LREGGAFRRHAPAVIVRKRGPSRSEGLPTKDLCTSTLRRSSRSERRVALVIALILLLRVHVHAAPGQDFACLNASVRFTPLLAAPLPATLRRRRRWLDRFAGG